MIRTLLITSGLLLGALGAQAETFEVKMLNRGDGGLMVFEPSSLTVSVGDIIKFLATDRGHNAESIEGMIPLGAEPFRGRINEEIEITLTEPGLYGVMCKPHYAMGMVMLITVGDVQEAPEGFFEGRIPPKAMERFEAQFGEF